MGFDYKKLAIPGFANIELEKRNIINYPDGETVEWYGFTRHNFELDGHKAFIVEPRFASPGLPWSWCTQWAEAFVPRTPALKLLERGFHHVHIDLFETRMNPEGIKIAKKFYDLLQSLGFNSKAALIGMSYGGLFSLRWAEEYPETVGAVYLDAPVTDLGFCCDRDATNALEKILRIWLTRRRSMPMLTALKLKSFTLILFHPTTTFRRSPPPRSPSSVCAAVRI